MANCVEVIILFVRDNVPFKISQSFDLAVKTFFKASTYSLAVGIPLTLLDIRGIEIIYIEISKLSLAFRQILFSLFLSITDQ